VQWLPTAAKVPQHVHGLLPRLSVPSPGDLAMVDALSALSRSACRDLLLHAGHVLVDCVQKVRVRPNAL